MEPYRASRGLRTLAALLSFLYAAAWVLAILVVIAAASVELFGGEAARRGFVLGVPATVEFSDLRLPSAWAGQTGAIAVTRADAKLEVPFWLAPGSFRAATYVVGALGYGMLLMFLYQVRGLFRKARDGDPFDARNATRLRWMAALIIGGHVLGRLFEAWQAATVLRTVQSLPFRISPAVALDERVLFSFNESVLLAALMLFALAEVFRRGAALEEEQSLVV